MRKGGLALPAQRYNPPGDPHRRPRRIERSRIRAGILLNQLRNRDGPVELVGIRFIAARPNVRQFFLALLELIGGLKREQWNLQESRCAV